MTGMRCRRKNILAPNILLQVAVAVVGVVRDVVGASMVGRVAVTAIVTGKVEAVHRCGETE
jgi:hypothetical protein